MKATFNIDGQDKTFDLTEIKDESMLNPGDVVLQLRPVRWHIASCVIAHVAENIIIAKPVKDGLDDYFENTARSNNETLLYRINKPS